MMATKATLQNRKRTKDLAETPQVEAKHEELLALKTEAGDELTQADNHFNEVKALIRQLKTKLSTMNKTNNANKLLYTRQAQQNELVACLKQALLAKAEEAAAKKIPQERIITICQALADDVRIGLAKQGIHMNPLTLTKHRS